MVRPKGTFSVAFNIDRGMAYTNLEFPSAYMGGDSHLSRRVVDTMSIDLREIPRECTRGGRSISMGVFWTKETKITNLAIMVDMEGCVRPETTTASSLLGLTDMEMLPNHVGNGFFIGWA